MRTLATTQPHRHHAPSARYGSKQAARKGVFAWLGAGALILAVIGISSCAGVTSGHSAGTPGTGGAGILTPSATSLSFGNVAVGNNSTQTLNFTNTGTASVNIEAESISGAGFTAYGKSPLSVIGVGQSGTLEIQFAPPSAGTVTGSLMLGSNAETSPLQIDLSGTGVSQGGHSVGLTWDASVSSGVTGYFVYRGVANGGPYTKLNSTQLAAEAFTDSSVTAGQEYFYVVTAIDSSDVESAYSNQVSATIP